MPLLNITITPRPFILYVLAFALLSACAASTSCQPTKGGQSPALLLQFQKSPCYGTCPAYEATIYQNGSVQFIGWEHVPVKDTVLLCLPRQQLLQLQTDIKQLNYMSLQDTYLSNWTDIPSTYLSFYQDGKEIKRIKHQTGGPEQLTQFQENLHKQLMQLLTEKQK